MRGKQTRNIESGRIEHLRYWSRGMPLKKDPRHGKAPPHLAPDGHMVVPGVALLLLGVGKVRGDGVGSPPPPCSVRAMSEGALD